MDDPDQTDRGTSQTHARLANHCFVLLLFRVISLAGQSTTEVKEPAEVVKSLYVEVVKRHPLGVPRGAARAAIWPLLSRRLIAAFRTRDACDRDWDRKHKDSDPPLKPPGFYEDGLFSGPNEEGYINGARVDHTKLQADGSYLVYVNVWSYLDSGLLSLRTQKKYRWQMGARVIDEDGRFVVNDILGFKGVFDRDRPVYTSRMLRVGCRGSRSID